MYGYISMGKEKIYHQYTGEMCGACEGTGLQTRKTDGITITCPVCMGSGKKNKGIQKRWIH